MSDQQHDGKGNGDGNGNGKLKSTRWFEGDDVPAFVHRTALRAEGFSTADFEGRPVIGICNSWSELINCNVHFRALANSVKRGVLQAASRRSSPSSRSASR